MLITLKQKEIEAALRLYISQRGINLAGKGVDIAFTAGRKESGVSAEVNIEDDTVITEIHNPLLAIAQAANDVVISGSGITMTLMNPASIPIDAAPVAKPDLALDPEAAPGVDTGKKSGSIFG